jgi:hypothetical protein
MLFCLYPKKKKNFNYKTGQTKPALSKFEPVEPYTDPSLSRVIKTIFADPVPLSHPHGTNTRLFGGFHT